MNELQQIIIESLIEKSKSMAELIAHIKQTFDINTLCDMLKINRNRYYYLKETNQLDEQIRELVRGLNKR